MWLCALPYHWLPFISACVTINLYYFLAKVDSRVWCINRFSISFFWFFVFFHIVFVLTEWPMTIFWGYPYRYRMIRSCRISSRYILRDLNSSRPCRICHSIPARNRWFPLAFFRNVWRRILSKYLTNIPHAVINKRKTVALFVATIRQVRYIIFFMG